MYWTVCGVIFVSSVKLRWMNSRFGQFEFPRAMWKSIRTTNALENLNREFRRRTKTQASFSSEESAVALLFGLIASGQIQLRRIDGYQRLSEILEHAEVAA